jgi:hypothetical protein
VVTCIEHYRHMGLLQWALHLNAGLGSADFPREPLDFSVRGQ